jgi:hypothetical protein
MLPSLPDLPPSLTAPDSIGPSQLANAGLCVLRVVATNKVNKGVVRSLGPHPQALLGTLVHRSLQEVGHRPATEILDRFALGLAKEFGGSAGASIGDTLPAASIERARKTLEAWVNEPWVNRASSRERGGRPGAKSPNRRGREVALKSTILGLSGSADLITTAPDGVVEVVDYKTGNVLDPDGSVRPEYVLQLQAYGLMLLELEPAVSVRLILDNGTRTELPSSRTDLEEARQSILHLRSLLPPGDLVSTSDWASPGPACQSCPVRPGCSAYRERAPEWWSGTNAPDFVPMDIWGRVKRWELTGPSACDVQLEDASGRLRVVRNLGLDRLSGGVLRSGDGLWFFALKSAPAIRRGPSGRILHPRAFFDLPLGEDLSDRAWNLELFGSSGSERHLGSGPAP